MKKNVFLLLCLILLSSHQVFAESKNIGDTLPKDKQEIQSQQVANNVEATKKAAETQIGNRLQLLNKLLSQINEDTKISDNEKSYLKNDINLESMKLVTLLNKIKTATTAESIKNGYKDVLLEKIYAFYIQKIHLLIGIDRLLVLENKLEKLTSQIQILVNTMQAEGKDTTNIQKTLSDMNALLLSTKTTLEKDKNQLHDANTSSYKTVFAQVRHDLSKVKSNFAKIREDITNIREEIKNANEKPAKTISPSVNNLNSSPSAEPIL